VPKPRLMSLVTFIMNWSEGSDQMPDPPTGTAAGGTSNAGGTSTGGATSTGGGTSTLGGTSAAGGTTARASSTEGAGTTVEGTFTTGATSMKRPLVGNACFIYTGIGR
jgi:hypothetical protein